MNTRILWADDEIDLLKPHVLFLESKGYEVKTVNNGTDAIESVEEENFDIVFLDENMPGLNGLETLDRIKNLKSHLPVIMITKSEEEEIMEEAIGGKIADYLIKPVNPNQILLSIKKNLETDKIVSEKTSTNYQREFRDIGMRLNDRLDMNEWMDLYKKIVYWELELQNVEDEGLHEILNMQKAEANGQFGRYVSNHYPEWIKGEDGAPVMSHNLLKKKVLPLLDERPVALIVIDNLRYDQWKVIEPLITSNFSIEQEELFCSILPTATHYARNALFAGLMPSEIEKKFPQYWLNEDDEGGKNNHEKELIEEFLKRHGKNIKSVYHKVLRQDYGKKVVDQFNQLKQNKLITVVFNFVDMLSHARTDMQMIKELAEDEAAYRSITKSWFEHSPLKDLLKKLSEDNIKVVLTTDHGTIRVANPLKIVGERSTNTNLRYKVGRNLDYNDDKSVYTVENPEDIYLNKTQVSSRFVFAKDDGFFVYPNNYNQYVKMYNDTFQHGGISLEEMLIPFVVLDPKS